MKKKAFFAAITLAALLSLVSLGAQAKMRLFACEPEWGALAEEIAGDHAKIFVATTAQQDPHHIEARPSLIAKMRRADIAVCTGAELEVGWLPLLIRTSGNKKIQINQPGYFEAASFVETLEKPEKIDRSLGDIHAAGNPHVHLGPFRLLTIAEALKDRLSQLDPAASDDYQQRFDDFKQRWLAAVQEWEQRARPLKGTKAVVFHRDWAYLFNWLGITRIAELEPKPGIPPSAGHLAELVQQVGDSPPDFIVYGPHQTARPANWLATQINSTALQLPFTVGGSKKAQDLFSLYEHSIELLLSAKQ